MPITVVMPDGKTYADGRVPSDFRPTEGQGRLIEAVAVARKQRGPAGVQGVGYAGVGKTTCMKIIGEEAGDPLVITPTGKAALRVKEATGLPASTLHRWLYANHAAAGDGPNFRLKPPEKLFLPSCKLVMLDEASMVTRDMWRDLWATAVRHNLKVVLIGDGFQLPPVENRDRAATVPPFNAMTEDFAAAHKFTRVELTEIVRQAADSPIVQAATRLRAFDAGGLKLLPSVATSQLREACVATLAANGVVICYTNVVRQQANAGLRQPALSPGEPLLVQRNNYDLDVYNGQQLAFQGWEHAPDDTVVISDKHTPRQAPIRYGVARVEGITSPVVLSPEEVTGTVDIGPYPYEDSARVWCRSRRYLTPAGAPLPYLHASYGYCLTAHKAQGSEWPWALVVLERAVRLTQEEGLRWAYTAITRAKTGAALHHGSP